MDEQKTLIEDVTKLLRQASKTGGGGRGAPEFIISNLADPDILVIVECKADSKDHASPNLAAVLLGTNFGEEEDVRMKRVAR